MTHIHRCQYYEHETSGDWTCVNIIKPTGQSLMTARCLRTTPKKTERFPCPPPLWVYQDVSALWHPSLENLEQTEFLATEFGFQRIAIFLDRLKTAPPFRTKRNETLFCGHRLPCMVSAGCHACSKHISHITESMFFSQSSISKRVSDQIPSLSPNPHFQ